MIESLTLQTFLLQQVSCSTPAGCHSGKDKAFCVTAAIVQVQGLANHEVLAAMVKQFSAGLCRCYPHVHDVEEVHVRVALHADVQRLAEKGEQARILVAGLLIVLVRIAAVERSVVIMAVPTRPFTSLFIAMFGPCFFTSTFWWRGAVPPSVVGATKSQP